MTHFCLPQGQAQPADNTDAAATAFLDTQLMRAVDIVNMDLRQECRQVGTARPDGFYSGSLCNQNLYTTASPTSGTRRFRLRTLDVDARQL